MGDAAHRHIWWSDAKRKFNLTDEDLRHISHEEFPSRHNGVSRRAKLQEVEAFVQARALSSKKPRAAPKCRCCGEKRGSRHAGVCTHATRKCSQCKREDEQKREHRKKVLEFSLRRVGLGIRPDSTLCEAYIEGYARKDVLEVTETMARFKYLYEGYCKEFEEACSELQRAVACEVEVIRETEGRYYSGIQADAVREVWGNGFRTIGQAINDLAGSWDRLPRIWPWQAPVVIQRRWRHVLYSPHTSVGKRRLLHEYASICETV